MEHELYSIAIYLNRDCVRNCPQCGISDRSRRPMSFEQFRDAFDILHEAYGTKFFLVLGVEPLLLKDDFVKIVKYWNDKNLFYAIYSTSPEPLFSKYRTKLLDVGLNNWSCGIDGIPGMGPLDQIVHDKTTDGLRGLKWMADHGVETFEVTTVTNKNLDYVPDIVEWCQENIPGCGSCINPVEWRHNETFDFFSKKEDMIDLVIPDSRLPDVERMIERMFELTRRPGYLIQNNDKFLRNFTRYFNTLDLRGNGIVGMGMDCDGTLRRCLTKNHFVPTENAPVRIQDLQRGDTVVGWDETNLEYAFTKVVDTQIRVVNEVYVVELGGGRTLECTGEHPFYVSGKGWTECKDLVEKDMLIRLTGSGKHSECMKRNNPSRLLEVRRKQSEFMKEKGPMTNSISREKVAAHSRSSESRKRQSKFMRDNNPMMDPEVRRKVGASLKGRCISEEQCKKISEAQRMCWKVESYREKMKPICAKGGRAGAKISFTPEKMKEYIKNRKYSKEGRRKLVATLRNNSRVMKVHRLARRYPRPTAPERFFIEACGDLPILYVGDGKFWLTCAGRDRNPDFVVEGQKKVVEVSNPGVHQTWEGLSDIEYEEKCKEFYGRVGYECLVIIIDKAMSQSQVRLKAVEFMHNGVEVVRIQRIEKEVEVYNVTCSPHSNFFVLPRGIDSKRYPAVLSHNCGYNKGQEICKYTVWDIPKDPNKIYDIWLADAKSCEGCYWSWIYSLEEDHEAAVLGSDYYTKRWGK